MTPRLAVCAGVLGIGLVIVTAAPLSASGYLGIYGIVEKVVFEPSEAAAERLQVWGAFMFVDGDAAINRGTSGAKKGYLYFKLLDVASATTESKRTVARREWNDLKTVAGTGQAVGFGNWMYFLGPFEAFLPDQRPISPSFISEFVTPPGGAVTDLRVRAASEPPASPAMYTTNIGVVKLTEASHAAAIKQLKDALK